MHFNLPIPRSSAQDLFGLVSGAAPSFTSPKKMMLLREAARESERNNAGSGSGNIGGAGSGNIGGGDDRLATLAGVASQLVASKSSVPGAETSAPEILVVPTSQTPGGGNSDRGGGGNVDVSANVTVETSRPRSLPTGIGLGVRSVLFLLFFIFNCHFKKNYFFLFLVLEFSQN